jgi:cyclic-di-AMP phosphodiesterase PgpH
MWRPLVLWLAAVVTLSALLYSVYGVVPAGTLVEGRPSPETFVSHRDVVVVNQLATERGRQQAREQIEVIYTADLGLQRLVLDALNVAPLPADARLVVSEAYRRPEGVRRAEIPAIIGRALGVTPEGRRQEVRLTLERILMPTAEPNVRLTEVARQAASEAFEPVTEVLQAGQVIVREGEILSADQLAVLEQLGLYNPERELVIRTVWRVGASLLLAMLLSLPLFYAYNRLQASLSALQIYALFGFSLLVLGGQRLALELSPSFIFVSLAALLVAVLVSVRVALAWGAFLSVITALMVPNLALPALIVALVSSTVAALLVGRLKVRAWLLVASLLASLGAALSLTVFSVLSGGLTFLPLLGDAAWVLGGGLLAGILALGFLPLAETNSVGFLTEYRLLELSNPSHPLLQRLMIEAPGSYQHSLIIANLVDQAVGNIGGNALLARVGALYHDVGKLRRPQFFVENQFSGENPHDRLSPHLSFLIITSHVRDGLELLREYKLPKALEPFVLEHHGTTVLSYFYKRALEESAHLDELNFRYAGPRPRSKETAVLMLADAVESASRSLAEPSQGSIRALIDRIVEQRLQDGQLADSPLNFHDLEVIANTFERMLTAMLHRRIRYPSSEEIQGLKHGGSHRRDPALPVS